MGTWDTSIKGNDTYGDLEIAFFELFNSGEELPTIKQKLLEENKQLISIEEEANNFWLGLALLFWEVGGHDEDLWGRAKKIIDSGDDLKIWKELGGSEKDLAKREATLNAFNGVIDTKNPNPKKPGEKTFDTPLVEVPAIPVQEASFRPAEFGKRALAFFYDIVPITILVAIVFSIFFGFDEVIAKYFLEQSIDSRELFLSDGDHVTLVSLFVWIFYSLIMDVSKWQGTHGKRIVKIKVTNLDGGKLTFKQSAIRNLTKVLSYYALGAGFLWVAFSKKRQGWHDILAKTLVMEPVPAPSLEKQIAQSVEDFKNRPIHKELTTEIIDSTSDDDLIQVVFDNISEKLSDDPEKEYDDITRLNKVQQAVYIVWWVEAEVNNGGFGQYYCNTSGRFAELAPESLRMMGAHKFRDLMERANNIHSTEDTDEMFDAIDAEFYELYKEEDLRKLMTRFIRNNKDKFIEKKITVPFDEQFATFERLGFKINEDVDFDEVIENSGGKEEFENFPYSFMYLILGGTIEREPWTPITDQLLHLDAEMIEDHGAYKGLLEEINRITGDEFNLENIEDYVDIEEGRANVSFDLNGEHYKWDLRVQDDWMDEQLIVKLTELMKQNKTKRNLTYYSGGQDFVLGWATYEEYKQVKKETGLDIIWFK